MRRLQDSVSIKLAATGLKRKQLHLRLGPTFSTQQPEHPESILKQIFGVGKRTLRPLLVVALAVSTS